MNFAIPVICVLPLAFYYTALPRIHLTTYLSTFYCFYFPHKETEAQKYLDIFPRLTIGYAAFRLGILLHTVIA